MRGHECGVETLPRTGVRGRFGGSVAEPGPRRAFQVFKFSREVVGLNRLVTEVIGVVCSCPSAYGWSSFVNILVLQLMLLLLLLLAFQIGYVSVIIVCVNFQGLKLVNLPD